MTNGSKLQELPKSMQFANASGSFAEAPVAAGHMKRSRSHHIAEPRYFHEDTHLLDETHG